jgi:hypothetical protein
MMAMGDGLPVLERIRRTLIALRMPRALEVLDHAVHQLERGEASALELIDTLLAEELSVRETSRIKTALRMGRLAAIKTLSGFDFSFQPSLDRGRILALAELQFVTRREVVHFLGPASRPSKPAAASTSPPLPISSGPWQRPSARASCASASAGSADPRSSSSMRSATCRSPTAAATCSSNSSTRATRKAR